MTVDCKVALLSAEALFLLRKGKAALASHEKTRAVSSSLPDDLGEVATPRIVFCGQYAAGKSSLLRLLTGRDDIRTGAGITTDQVSFYDWNGVEVADTPGILTSVRPDHDERSYAAIGRADAVVFVTTNELMDSTVGRAFRELAFERHRASAMMLVVNKMGRTANGNCDASRKIAVDGLRPVMLPSTPETMPVVCTDAEDGLKARREQDPAKRERLWQRSNFDELVAKLDEVATLAGASSKLRQPLFALETALNDGLGALGNDGSTEGEMERLLVARRNRIVEAREEARRAARERVRAAASNIRRQGSKAASGLHGGASKEAVERGVNEAYAEVERISKELPGEIDRDVAPIFQTLGADLARMASSPEAAQLLGRLKGIAVDGLKQIEVDPAVLEKAKKVSDVAQEVGKFLLEQSFNPKVATAGGLLSFRSYSNTAMHEFVKSAGKSLGYRFAPWEAIRLTRGIAMFGRVLGAVGAVVSVISVIKSDIDNAAAEEAERAVRGDIVDAFDQTAQVVETFFDRESGTYLSSTFAIAQVDEQLEKLRAARDARTGAYAELADLLASTRDLIRRVNATEPGAS